MLVIMGHTMKGNILVILSVILCSVIYSGHDYQFFESSGPLRGFKRSVHEGGVRSPLLIRWVMWCASNCVHNQLSHCSQE